MPGTTENFPLIGNVEGTMIYVCNYLDQEIGCDYREEVKAAMDQGVLACGHGRPSKTTPSVAWT